MEIIEEVAKKNTERILEEFLVFLKRYPREFATEGYFVSYEFSLKEGIRYDYLLVGKNQTKLYDRIEKILQNQLTDKFTVKVCNTKKMLKRILGNI